MRHLALGLLFLRVALPRADGDRPADVVHQATRAIDGDSAVAVAARWSARLARDSADQAAALGLATIARLSYRPSDADVIYALVPGGAAYCWGLNGTAQLGDGTTVQRLTPTPVMAP
jgi:hypothetical protein